MTNLTKLTKSTLKLVKFVNLVMQFFHPVTRNLSPITPPNL